jgi:hypothetical protein
MGLWDSYRMRLRRKRLLIRALRKRRELRPVANRTSDIRCNDLLLFATQRNEMLRLPWFLEYYRDLGIGHFLIVDNDSDDGSLDYLAGQPDVSVWTTRAGYKASRFGMDWMNALLGRYGDMYPKGPIGAVDYRPGQNPLDVLEWFDAGNYTISRNWQMNNLWIQGGPRARVFFADQPKKAPALNKIPLVRWQRRYAYASSTHALLPRGLNLVYDDAGGEKSSGLLLHTKFLPSFPAKAEEELSRGQHYGNSREYIAYAETVRDDPDLWCRYSEKYINWRQLEILGLMSKGNWA